MVIVLASIYVNKGAMEKFLDIFKANVPAVLAEDGCIEYAPTIDYDSDISIQDKNVDVVVIVEKWASHEALKMHLNAPHMLTYKEAVADLVENVTIKILKDA